MRTSLMWVTVINTSELFKECWRYLVLFSVNGLAYCLRPSFDFKYTCIAKFHLYWAPSEDLRRSTVWTPRIFNTKKATFSGRWQWFGPLEGCELKLEGRSIYLYVCVRTCVTLYMPVGHPGGGGNLCFFYKISAPPPLRGSLSILTSPVLSCHKPNFFFA